MNGGTCLRETVGKRVPRGRKKNVRCNRSGLLTNSLPYKERQVEGLLDEPVTSPSEAWSPPASAGASGGRGKLDYGVKSESKPS
jgi:hypothetical protein